MDGLPGKDRPPDAAIRRSPSAMAAWTSGWPGLALVPAFHVSRRIRQLVVTPPGPEPARAALAVRPGL